MGDTGTVRTRLWRHGKLEKEDFPFEDISTYLAEDGCLVWADICAPDRHRLDALAEELSLDPHAVEDATEHRERPKAVRYHSHFFLTVHPMTFDAASATVELSQVSVFAVRRGVFTVRQADFDMTPVVKRWDEDDHLCRFGPHALVFGLLDFVVDQHFEAIEAMDDEIEAIEDVLFDEDAKRRTEVSRRSFQLRKSLVTARRAVLPNREVVSTLMRGNENNPMVAEMRPYYDDLYDHVLRASEWTDSLRDMIATIFETNLSLSDARLNTIMKKLTSWAAIIAVPTAVTGFYGQNVPYPGFGHIWGFWTGTVAMIVIVAALYLSFRRRDWL